jgi:hypothetical protein
LGRQGKIEYRICHGPKAYLETTIVSYLAAAPSRNIVVAGRQQITQDGWERRAPVRAFFDFSGGC